MRRNIRQVVAALVALLICATGLLVLPQSSLTTAQAAPAEGTGADDHRGQHADSIYWLDWEDATNTAGSGTNHGRPYHRVQNGTSVEAQPVPGVTVTATFSNVQAGPRSGSGTREVHVTPQDPAWSELRLNGYNTLNQYSVITPNTNNSTVSFTLDIDASFDDGTPLDVNVIAADGESAGPHQNETNVFTTNGERWQNIDNTTRSGAQMWWSDRYNGGFGTVTMGPWVTEMSTGQGMAPIGVSRNASQIDVDISATGMQNVMIGFMMPADFGDAPESYGQASHYIDWDGVGDPMAHPSSADAPTIDYVWDSNPYLGDTPADPDSGGSTEDWVGDDQTGDADEGWEQLTGDAEPPALYRGNTADYSVTVMANNAEGLPVRAWIDWNNNGIFDANERAEATVTDGQATLTWQDATVPADVEGLGARFRIASDSTQIEEPTGLAADGEVEDYLLPVQQAPLASVVKSANPDSGTEVQPGQTIDYTLTFTNDSDVQAVVDHTDHLEGVLDDATLEEDSITSSNGLEATFEASDETLRITGSMAPGADATVTYSAVVNEYAATTDQHLVNFVVPGGATPPEECAPESELCTEHPVTQHAPDLALEKGSDPESGTTVHPGDEITYTVTVTNQDEGDEAVGPATGVVVTDNLTDVLNDASFQSGSAQLAIDDQDPLAVADPVNNTLSTEPFDLPAGSTASLTYTVAVDDAAWSTQLVNVVTGTWQNPENPDTPEPITCDECTTEHTTGAKLFIEKLGESTESTWVRMDGSDWAVFTDDNGTLGAELTTAEIEPVPSTENPEEPETGLFHLEGIPAGDYWLTETRAPEGFSLLAEPVGFNVASDGSVTLNAELSDLVAVGTDSDSGLPIISVRDVPAMELPETGSTGRTGYYLLGGLLLTSGAAMALRFYRRQTV